jgi:phosphomannomutase
MARGSLDSSIFKAYDIRGLSPSQIDESAAWRVGNALAQLPLIACRSPRTIVVGRDSRENSDILFDGLVLGAAAGGAEIIDIGLCTTPMLYFAVNVLGSAGGAMITASHNPKEYNGFKLVRDGAIPIAAGAGLEEVQALAMSARVTQSGRQRPASRREEVLEQYATFFAERFRVATACPVYIDTGNGAVGAVLPEVLNRQNIPSRPLFFDPDGRFPNHDPNPLIDANLTSLRAAVGADETSVGVAYDGDGDRVCFVDEGGHNIRGDLVTALIAGKLLETHPGRKVLYDLRASRIVPQVIREAGGEPIRTRVGHVFIKLQMRDAVALFAGELSYHFYFEDFFYCESGIYAMLQVLDILSRTGKSLAALVAPLRQYAHSGEINFDVTDANEAMEEIERRFKDGDVDHLDGLTVEYPSWWFNLRPSNTEPLLRLNLEADSEELMKRRLEEVSQLLARCQGRTR